MKFLLFKVIFTSFFVFSYTFLLSQNSNDPISIGNYKILRSEFLGEDRVVTIHLHKSYNESQLSYPVVYHAYGDRIEQYYAGAVDVVSNFHGTAPEVILVGIDERNLRYRDLLPQSPDGKPTGIDLFTGYIANELMPYISSNFRTKDYNIFVGPQVAANFGFYILFKKPDIFDAFIITNPFRWEGGRELQFMNLESYISSNKSLRKFLFITHNMADPLEVDGNSYINRFKEIVNQADLDGFQVEFNFLENGYDFISPTGFREGMQSLFRDYKIPPEQTIETLNDLKNYYQQLSSKLGFEVDIPELVMAMKSDEWIEDENVDKAEELLKYAESLYPNGFNALWRLGEVYRQRGANEEAIYYYRKVLSIYPDMNLAQDYIDELSN